MLSMADFLKVEVEIHIGTILSARSNAKARKPAYVPEVDCGPELGVKTTSAQLTDRCTLDELPGRQRPAVTNSPPLRVAGLKSEALAPGAAAEDGAVRLSPDRTVANGRRNT